MVTLLTKRKTIARRYYQLMGHYSTKTRADAEALKEKRRYSSVRIVKCYNSEAFGSDANGYAVYVWGKL
jgi:hypothetical protein